MAADKAAQIPFGEPSLVSPKADETVARLSKVLSTSAGVDSMLTLVGYALSLTSTSLLRLQTLSLKVPSDPSTLKLSTRLHSLAASLTALSGMCNDCRTFTRLWGLLGIYNLAKKNYVAPPEDTYLRVLAYGQTMAMGGYLWYENGAFLASKGVLKGWTAGEMKRWGKVSIKCFLAFLLLEFGRLGRVLVLRNREKAARAEIEKDQEYGSVKRWEKIESDWRQGVLVNAAYTPLAMHWASEEGLLGGESEGALMTWIGWVKVKAAWAGAA